MLEEFTLIEHLTELRKRIVRCVICFILLFIYVYTKTNELVDYLIHMSDAVDFIYIKPEELVMSYLKVDLLAALLLTIPVIIFQSWRFIRPALKKKERLKCAFFFLMATILFFVGVWFSLYVTAPLCLHFFSEFTHYAVSPMLTIENYLSFIINLTLMFGVVFDVPAVVFILASLGLLKYSTMKKYGKYIILLLLILAAVLTPPDVISQLLLFGPLLLLYEFSVFICYTLEKKDGKKFYQLFRRKKRVL